MRKWNFNDIAVGQTCDFRWKTVKNPTTIVASITALVSKLTLEITGEINQMKCDAEPLLSSVFLCAGCFSAASREESKDRRRGGRRQRSGREVYAGRTRVRTTHVKMTVCTRVWDFFFFLWLCITSEVPFFLLPSSKTNRANEKKPPCDKEVAKLF